MKRFVITLTVLVAVALSADRAAAGPILDAIHERQAERQARRHPAAQTFSQTRTSVTVKSSQTTAGGCSSGCAGVTRGAVPFSLIPRATTGGCSTGGCRIPSR